MSAEFKHSFLVITYNQEAYIREALDSVLLEEPKPMEIIIGDDASTDGTRHILKEYKRRFPNIISLIFHPKNLGIFANLDSLSKLPKGDMIHILAGDDSYAPNYLRNVNETLHQKNFNLSVARAVILPKVLFRMPDGRAKLYGCDERRLAGRTAVSLGLRDIFQFRYSAISRASFDCWPPHPADSNAIGPWADRMHYIHLFQFVDYLIPVSYVGNIYRVGVGIASRTESRELKLSYLASLQRIKVLAQAQKIGLTEDDKRFLDYEISFRSTVLSSKPKSIMALFALTVAILISNPTDFPIVFRMFYGIVRGLLPVIAIRNLTRRWFRTLKIYFGLALQKRSLFV